MWQKKQKNLTFPGQMMGPPPGPPSNFNEHIVLPFPSSVSGIDFLDESSRKRKATSLEQLDNYKGESIFEYCLTKESNPQHKFEAPLGSNVQRKTLGMFSNQAHQYVEPNNMVHQFHKHQSHGRNDLPAGWQITIGNFPKPGAEKINNSFMPPQSSNHKGLSFLNGLPVAEIFTVPNQQIQASNTISQSEVKMVNQTEVHKSSLYLSSSNAYKGNSNFGPGLKAGMTFWPSHHSVLSNPTLELYNTSSKSLRSLEVSQQRLPKDTEFATNLEGKPCSQEASSFDSYVEVEKSGRNTNVTRAKDVPTVGASSLSNFACTEEMENHIPCQNYEGRTGSSCGVSSGDDTDGKAQSLLQRNKIMKKIEGSSIVNMSHSKGVEILPENACSSAQTVLGNENRDDPSHGSLKTDGKIQAGKVGPSTAEKLWDGSLQLNSSVTVSAIAFFKSGEKAPEFNWSKFIEVKGKVRLEAFEKFIQELPRSRNRGLMVISLCWKVGSSKTGLTGIKEVSKSYQEGERVGFAQLSSGTDLYVCPRSEAIITILAKYGFFKGMAVVGDDQDSLIGCVVWRRIRTTANSVVKETGRKNLPSSGQPPDHSSNSSHQQEAERNSSNQQSAQDSSPIGFVGAGSRTIENVGSMGTESRNIQSDKIECTVGNSSSVDNLMPTPVTTNSSISVELQAAPCTDSSSLHGPVEQLLKSGVLNHSSEIEKPMVSFELKRPVLVGHSQVIKPQDEPVPDSDDDDDLPEFDFGKACGVSQNAVGKPVLPRSKTNVADTAPSNKNHPVEGFKNMHGPVPPTMCMAKPMVDSNQQRSENSKLLGLAPGNNQGMPPPNTIKEHESRISVLPFFDEKCTVKNSDTLIRSGTLKPADVNVIPPRKNIWDDDDMPEWQPPDMENHGQPAAGSVSRSSNPLELSNSTSGNLQPPPPLKSRLPSPSPVLVRPPWSSHGLSHVYHSPITITMNSTQPRPIDGYIQSGPTSSRFSSRPQSFGFDVKPPIHPPGWRGWKI